MDIHGKKLREPVETRDSRSPEFPDRGRPAARLVEPLLSPVLSPGVVVEFPASPGPAVGAAILPVREFDMWKDVFVGQGLPWKRFLQSGLVHLAAIYVIGTTSLSLMQEQKIIIRPVFD